MFKKIEIWILYLVLLINIIIAVGFGILVRQELEGSTKMGWLSEFALSIAETPANIKRALKGHSVEDRFDLNNGFHGTPNNQNSYILLSRYDGDLKTGLVDLIDLTNFKTLHTWNPDLNAFNDLVDNSNEFKNLKRDGNNARTLLLHPKLVEDGGLLFSSFNPLKKINSCSELMFQNSHDKFHHSLETDYQDNIWVPSHIYPQTIQEQKVGRDLTSEGGYHDDGIAKLSSEGELLYEKSVSQIFIENDLEYLLFSTGDRYFNIDPIHLNDIQPVDFDSKYWKRGDIFLSLRHQSMILLYRPSTNKIIWKGVGPFFHQHDVDILDDHRISIFNNNSKDFINGDIIDGNNEVIIYNFNTNQYSSYLSESLIKHDVRTITGGRSQILPNGDLLIEETNYGRTLYFNKDGSLRWLHLNRANNGRVYGLGWSRILYNEKDLQIVKKFMRIKELCNE